MNPSGRPTEIQIACLESRAEMPAFASEIDPVLEEGGVLHRSWGPKKIVANGRVNGIELVRCTGVFDEAEHFNPAFDSAVTTMREADTVILAIGQSTDLSFLAEADRALVTERGTILVDEATLATPVAGVLAGSGRLRQTRRGYLATKGLDRGNWPAPCIVDRERRVKPGGRRHPDVKLR